MNFSQILKKNNQAIDEAVDFEIELIELKAKKILSELKIKEDRLFNQYFINGKNTIAK